MEGRKIWAALAAVSIISILMTGIGIEIGTQTQVGKKIPSFIETIKDFQTLIAALVALAAAIYAALPVWRQLAQINIQSAVQTRELLHTRADAAGDYVKRLHRSLNRIGTDKSFPDAGGLHEQLQILEDLLIEIKVTYWSDNRFDALASGAETSFADFRRKIRSGDIEIKDRWDDDADGTYSSYITVDVPQTLTDALLELLGEIAKFLEDLRRRIMALDDAILDVDNKSKNRDL